MKASLQVAALLWPALGLTLAIPSLSTPPKPDADEILTAVGSSSKTDVSIHFEAPCHGCFVGTEDGLTFDLSVHTVATPCGQSNFSLNNLQLSHKWDGDQTAAHGILYTKLANGLGHREIQASWQISCLQSRDDAQDAAHMLTVNVHKIGKDGSFRTVTDPSGFTVSYRPQGSPEIIRLSGKPVKFLPDNDFIQGWLKPSTPDRFTISDANRNFLFDESLEDEINQLQALKAYAFELKGTIKSKERKVHELEKQDFESFKTKIKECGSLKCMLQTAWHKIPQLAHIISAHIRHRFPSHVSHQKSSPENFYFGEDESSPPENFFFGEDESTSTNEPAPPSFDNDGPPHPQNDEGNHSHPPQKDEGHAPPPFTDDVEEHPPPDHDHEKPPFPPHHGHDGPPHPPHRHPGGPHGHPPFHHGRHHRFLVHLIFRAVLVLFVVVALFSVLFYVLYSRVPSSSARRTDCAFNRESRRRACAYRRAARQHKWSQWWSQYRRPKSNTDYDEKRALILGQEAVLENAMQEELQGLRLAQDIIDGMSQADRERARLYHEANFPPLTSTVWQYNRGSGQGMSHSPPARLDTSSMDFDLQRFGSSSRLQSLPSYFTGSASGEELPPRYDEELEGDMTVVDGFQYTPSPTGSTPASSVIDCSPRLSMETGRTNIGKRSED